LGSSSLLLLQLSAHSWEPQRTVASRHPVPLHSMAHGPSLHAMSNAWHA
jgi:hypothetical protein